MAYSSQYWRFDFTEMSGSSQLSEIEFFDGSGAAISRTGATATASSTGTAGGASPPSALLDGDTSTWWFAGNTQVSATVYITLASSSAVGSVSFIQKGSALGSAGPNTVTIYISADGSTWTQVCAATFTTWSGTTPQTVILTAAEVYQLGTDALTVNNPAAQAIQLGADAFTINDPSAAIYQGGIDALTVNDPAAQVYELGLEAFVQYAPVYEVFQLGADAFTINDPSAAIYQGGIDALTVNDPAAQVYELGLEAFVQYVSAPVPAPLTVARKPGTRIDMALVYDSSLRALDAVFDGTNFALDETPASVLLASLLVDRRAHVDDTWPPPVPNWSSPSSFSARGGWVGDALDSNGLLVGSRLWELDRRLADEQTRSDCQDYIVEALSPLESQRGYAIQIQVAWEMPQILGYSVSVGSTTIQLKKALS